MNIHRKTAALIEPIKTACINIVKQLKFDRQRRLLERNLSRSASMGVSEKRYCDHDIIVSLTTYGKRIHTVHLAIESIMNQTMKANRIILWLDFSFKNKPLPRTLQLQQKRGLEIRFCKDIKSYKKLIPTLCEFPDDAIITVDDDMIYEIDLLEHLIMAYQLERSYIYCCRHHRMLLDANKKLLSYNLWKHEDPTVNEGNVMNFPTGGEGILYPPHSLDEEVFNESVFMNICPYADDVWFKAMALKKGTLSKKVRTHDPSGNDSLENLEVQDVGLKRINTEGECLNDMQIAAVFRRYSLYKYLNGCLSDGK